LPVSIEQYCPDGSVTGSGRFVPRFDHPPGPKRYRSVLVVDPPAIIAWLAFHGISMGEESGGAIETKERTVNGGTVERRKVCDEGLLLLGSCDPAYMRICDDSARYAIPWFTRFCATGAGSVMVSHVCVSYVKRWSPGYEA
jgi:hypothetical protein